MTELVEFSLTDGDTVLFEVAKGVTNDGTPVRGWRDQAPGKSGGSAEPVVRRAGSSFEEAVESIRPTANALVAQLRSLSDGPQEIVIEFGLQMSAKAGAFIAEAATAANFKVTLTWRDDSS
ncbi:CU044_2847 family protein (plasmid) [Rhodococcus opacus]|uniref:CU044_2847 family protein n=1 Tax=Rhodococcus opacus TaxID=37919 RepID=UPI0034D3324B